MILVVSVLLLILSTQPGRWRQRTLTHTSCSVTLKKYNLIIIMSLLYVYCIVLVL